MFLYETLKKTADVYPDKTALSYDGVKIAYSELKARVNTLFNGFVNQNITPNLRVGLFLHNSIDFVVCLYALSRNGNTTCLLNTELSPEAFCNKLQSAKLDIVIMENYLYDMASAKIPNLVARCKIILRRSIDSKMGLSDFMADNGCQQDLEDMKYEVDTNTLIQSSSGTTGFSKMAYRTQKNLMVDTDNIISTFNYKPEDIFYCTVPLCHGFGLTMGLIAPIKCGATIHIERWFMANRFFSIYHELKPTIFIGTPETYDNMNKYINNNKYSFNYNKWFLCSGSPLGEETGIKFNEKFDIWINQVYGMMEASTIAANLEPNKENFLSVGKPVNNVSVKQWKAGSKGDYGEILVKSEAVSSDYIELGETTKLPMTNGFFRTSDISKLDSNGNIFIIGRKANETINKK